MNGPIIPCDICDRAVFGFDEYQPHGGFLRCSCPFRDKAGRCNCDEAQKINRRMEGVE